MRVCVGAVLLTMSLASQAQILLGERRCRDAEDAPAHPQQREPHLRCRLDELPHQERHAVDCELVMPAEQYGSVRVGMAGKVTLGGHVAGTYNANVVVDRLIDAASGTFGVRLQLANPGNRIPAGIRCGVRLVR